MSRILRSSASSLPNSFFSAYHFERQSLLTAIRSPIGLVFCPITKAGQPPRLFLFQRFQLYFRSFDLGPAGRPPSNFICLTKQSVCDSSAFESARRNRALS